MAETLGACFMRLSIHTDRFLPCVHQTWPCLVARVTEAKTALLIHLMAIEMDHHYHHHHKSSPSISTGSILASSSGGIISNTTTALEELLTTLPSHTNNTTLQPHHHQHHHYHHHHCLVVLPFLLDLVSLLSITASSFMTNKLKEDLLPEVLQMLCAFHHHYIHAHNTQHHHHQQHHRQAIEGSMAAQHHSRSSSSSSNSHHQSKHSLRTKIKVALLSMVLQLVNIPSIHRTLQSMATSIVWFIVPCLAAYEVSGVDNSYVDKRYVVLPSVRSVDRCVDQYIYTYMLLFYIYDMGVNDVCRLKACRRCVRRSSFNSSTWTEVV